MVILRSSLKEFLMKVYRVVYYIHMDFSLALQDEYLLEKNSEKNKY